MNAENSSASSTPFALPIRTLPSPAATLPRRIPPQHTSTSSSSSNDDDDLLGPVPSCQADDDWCIVSGETTGGSDLPKLTISNIEMLNTMNNSTVYDRIQQKSKPKLAKQSVKVRGSKTRVSDVTIDLDGPYCPASAAEGAIYGVGAWADMARPPMSWYPKDNIIHGKEAW